MPYKMNRYQHLRSLNEAAVASKNCAIPHDEELCCPVCEASLACHPNYKPDAIEGNTHEATVMRNEMREIRAGKLKDAELTVAALCGHIFHRFCLRHYCYVYQQANNTEQVECPVCMKDLSMFRFQPIDLKAHMRIASSIEKTYAQSFYVNNELLEQKEVAHQGFKTADNKLHEAKMKLEAYRNYSTELDHKVKEFKHVFKEKEKLCRGIAKCNKGVDDMHKENINIIKMYLKIMKDQPEEFLREKNIPAPLIPYLAIILADDKLVKKFGEILKPIEVDGLKSDTEVLIKEILADVRTKTKGNHRHHHHLHQDEISKSKGKRQKEKEVVTVKPKPNPVVVKVQRSTVSIFSRTALDKESLQKIMHEIKEPISKLQDLNSAIWVLVKGVVTTP